MTSRPTTVMFPTANDTSKSRAVAYYCSTVAESDEAIEWQREQVRRWAEEHGVEIVREFIDSGTSGRRTEPRPGFGELMEWVKKGPSFKYVLCHDMTRWGRFQGHYSSDPYIAECLNAGKIVIYTIAGKAPENDRLYPVYLQFNKFLVEPCRPHSARVQLGRRRAAEKGYWLGGNTPYGLRRLLLDSKGNPLCLLGTGERKTKQKHRVVLVAGEPAEVATIRRIFRDFVDLGHTLADIAKERNAKGIESPGGGEWKTRHVLACLRNEVYAKPISYCRKRANGKETPDVWIHMPKARMGIVSLEQYRRGQEMLG